MLKQKTNQLKHYYELAKSKKVKLSQPLNYVLANIDKVDVPLLLKEIKLEIKAGELKNENEKKMQKLKSRKQFCLRKLKNADVPKSIIDSIKLCKNIDAIEKILDTFPPVPLFTSGLRKSKYGSNHLTENSIYKAISVRM
jgi:hypothetical protein